ncbi:M28 family peptidase [Algoriphagus sp. C2-7]|uniref:M28 family peptidase n=2 Tax=Algoriphagus sediminis TaxID=3057113 RepID=A0ABT7YBY5_9BACT|nr:M28 family peptidase [Algoriphagus sediminis]
MQLYRKVGIICFLAFIYTTSFSQSIDSKNLMRHLVFLSSDELKGRKTSSEGNLKAIEYIQNEFQTYGLKTHYKDYLQRFSFRSFGKVYEDAANVIGFIPGRESDKIIVISAHFDHLGLGQPNSDGDSIYNGADDNASGTAALLAIAEYFSKNPAQHSLMFAAFDSEELGLRGSKAFLEDFPFELDQIALNVNMDMVGRNDSDEIYASGTYQNPQLKGPLEIASEGSVPELLFGHDQPGMGRDDWTNSSDHGSFVKKGISHIYFGVEDHEDYHTQDDEFDGINPKFFVGSANLILKCILELDKFLVED